MSLLHDRVHLRMQPGGRRYRRVRGALTAIPLLILLPSLVMAGFRGTAPDSSHAAATSRPQAADTVVGGRGADPLTTGSPAVAALPANASGMPATAPATAPTAAPTGPASARWTPNPTAAVSATPTSMPTAKPTPKPPSVTPPPAPTPPQPPAGTSLALGVWTGQPWNPSSLNALTSLLGRAPKVFLTYVGWDRPFYSSDESQIANRGASHVVTWEPNGYSLKSIAAGDEDAFIRAWAQGAAAWGHTIYLRPMHEMNGDWYPWGRGVGGNTAADFVNAWRHMHDIFVAAGATNVKWVWSPNVRYGSLYPLADLYPGSAYVDWLGLDGYNWGLDHHLGSPSWQSFGEIFGAAYREVTKLAPGKPLMVAETASTENGGSKAQWILQTFLSDAPTYSALRAVIWFNQADGASNFKIDSSAASLAAFRQVASSAAWMGRLP